MKDSIKKKDMLSRRNALKRMSKGLVAVGAIAAIGTLAGSCYYADYYSDYYGDYSYYSDYSDYSDYANYVNYSNYYNYYINYSDYGPYFVYGLPNHKL